MSVFFLLFRGGGVKGGGWKELEIVELWWIGIHTPNLETLEIRQAG